MSTVNSMLKALIACLLEKLEFPQGTHIKGWRKYEISLCFQKQQNYIVQGRVNIFFYLQIVGKPHISGDGAPCSKTGDKHDPQT